MGQKSSAPSSSRNVAQSSAKAAQRISSAVKDASYVNRLFFPGGDGGASSSYSPQLPDLAWLPVEGEEIPITTIAIPYEPAASNLILYFHGNAADLGHIRPFLKELSISTQSHVIGVEYPGYGIAPGRASEGSVNRVAAGALACVRDTLGWPMESTVVFGRSIGTGPACQLASQQQQLAALVLVSPYTSIAAMARELAGPVGAALVADRFVSRSAIATATCPTLLVHGDSDTLIPAAHSAELQAASGSPLLRRVLLPGVGHNDVFRDVPGEIAAPLRELLLEAAAVGASADGGDATAAAGADGEKAADAAAAAAVVAAGERKEGDVAALPRALVIPAEWRQPPQAVVDGDAAAAAGEARPDAFNHSILSQLLEVSAASTVATTSAAGAATTGALSSCRS